METPEQRLAKIREQGRNRAKKFYEKHKQAILEKHKQINFLANQFLKLQINKEEEKVEPIPEPIHEPIHEPTPKEKKKKIIFSKDKVIELLNEYPFEEETTRKTYINNVNMIFKAIPNCENLEKCFNNPKVVNLAITNLKKSNGGDYSLNSKKALYQGIVFIIDKLGMNVKQKNKQNYLDAFTEKKISSKEQTKERQKEEEANEYPTFTAYLKKVEGFYGKEGKEYLVTKIYEEIPVRDNFQLIIVPNMNAANNNKKNYLVLPRKKEGLKVILNKYKTFKKYGKQEYTLTKGLSDLLLKYIENKNIEFEQPIFSKLSQYVAKMNKVLGYGNLGGINAYRHMAVSHGLNDITELPEEEQTKARIELSKKLLHSVNTQEAYKRPISKK